MTNVLVLGLAETGLVVARRLRAEGAAVTVAEDFPSDTAKYRERVAALEPLGVDEVIVGKALYEKRFTLAQAHQAMAEAAARKS